MNSPRKVRARPRSQRERAVDDRPIPAPVSSEQAVGEGPKAFEGTLTIQPGRPAVWSRTEAVPLPVSAEKRALIDQLLTTLRAYRGAAKTLLAGTYAGLRDVAPAHLRVDCDVAAIVCDDGIIVRRDRHDPSSGHDPKTRIAFIPESVTKLARQVSEGFIHCPLETAGYDIGPDAPRVALLATSLTTGESRVIADGRVAIVVPWGELTKQEPAKNRPVPYVSVPNEFDLLVGAERSDESEPRRLGSGQRFLLRSKGPLGMGWETFEVYPPFDAQVWQPAIAPAWAELDLLAAAARHNLRDQQFREIDPNAAARRQFASLLKQLRSLLDGPENPLQQFLKDHPKLLSLTHTHMWPKLPMGARETDFVFREPPNDYLLVELEAPVQGLFRKDGQPREELVHALDQVTDWQRYIEDNLATVQRELGLTGISAQPRILIVIGRSESLTERDRRKLVTMQNQFPKTRIMTYDDLLASAKAAVENLLGPLWETEGNAEVYYIPG